MRKNLANIITITRIIGTLCLIPLDVFSTEFFVVYIYCGLSDVLDGFVARKLKIISPFGSKLDTISDLLFYGVMMLKIWPYLQMYLPNYIWFLIYLILFLRLCSYFYVYFKDKTLSSRHTILNKITGVLMFILPFIVRSKYLIYYSFIVLIIAYVSELDEIKNILKR